MLDKRLEDLDYRIAQYQREGHHEQRLVRRRKSLLDSYKTAHDLMEEMAGTLSAEEDKLGHGIHLFHRGLERRMVEDIVAVENLSVFKAACQYDAVTKRIEDVEAEVLDINGALERMKDHHDQLAMLEDWREDVYERADRDARERNALLHRRLEVWLRVAEREDDIKDLETAGSTLEDALQALEASITAGTHVRKVEKRDLAVLANLQPMRTKQFLIGEMLRKAKEAYRHTSKLIDQLQGVEHLKVHIRDPIRILDVLTEAMLLDYYEGDRPFHALREVHEQHRYLKQIRSALRKRNLDVQKEIEDLKVEEDELLLLAVDRRL
ncbi:MAG: hypothetical protein JSW25_03325, partial [Thermoplasmata archaeon]